MAQKEEYTALLIGAAALLMLAKWGLPKIPNPFPAVGQVTKKVGQELTGGITKSSDESTSEWLFEFDVPFSDKRLPLAPGLVRDQGDVYTTVTTGAVAMDIVEPPQSWGSYWTELDLPGLEPYDLRDAPGDLYSNTLGKILR